MPPFSYTLEEEGACIKSVKLVENGIFKEPEIIELLLAPGKIKRESGAVQISGARRLADNISDLKAQVAANQKGIELLNEMVDYYSLDIVLAYMYHIQDNAEIAVRNMLKRISKDRRLKPVDTVSAQDYLDDGSGMPYF